eukprot:jgi/Astpho2/4201/fgenesh1_pg.00064_%23_21_t
MDTEGVYYKINGRRYYVHDQVMILACEQGLKEPLRPKSLMYEWVQQRGDPDVHAYYIGKDTLHGGCSLRAPHARSTGSCRPLYLRSRSAAGPTRCHAHQAGKQLGQSMAAALAAAVLMAQPVAAASLKETASDQLEKTTTQLERLFKKVEQSQGDSPLDPERKGKPFGVGDPEFKLKAPLTGESSRKASKYSVGPTVQGDVPPAPPLHCRGLPGRGLRLRPSRSSRGRAAKHRTVLKRKQQAAKQGQKGAGTLQQKGSAPAPKTSEDKAESKREADTINFAAKSSPNSEQQKQPPQVAPETAPSSANVPNPLKNLPVLTDPAAPISQSAQETLSEKGGAAAETVKKAADQAPGLFDLLKGV